MNKNNLYSYHVFLFPFQWKMVGKEFANSNLEEQSDLKPFLEMLHGSSWKRSNFKTDAIIYFNEKNYFYPFVRDILYDKGNTPNEQAPEFIAHYEYNMEAESMDYTIQLANDNKYILQIDSILLHLYSTGIGIISFHLNNRIESQSKPDDILKINQFGRRLYPPFLSMNSDLIGSGNQFRYSDYEKGLEGVKSAELAHSISVGQFKEDWSRFKFPVSLETDPFIIPEFISGLFASVPLTGSVVSNVSEPQVFIQPILGDRMFVVCWYGNDKIVDEFRTYDIENDTHTANIDKAGNHCYLSNEWLYKYIYVDKNLGCRNDKMRVDLMKNSINARWLDYGTLFGASRYSFVAITQSLQNEDFRKYSGFVVNHVQTMYYKLVELTLVQRASVLKFSDEVTRVSSMDNAKNLSQQVNSLYKQYIRFVNKIYFREVTAEEQGIELYDLLKKTMRIDDNVKDLDNEINELHNYLNIIEESRRNNYLEILTSLGAAFIIPTFIAGFFGMNMFESEKALTGNSLITFIVVISVIPSLILFIINRRKRITAVWVAVGYLVLLSILLIASHYFFTLI